MVVVLAFLWPYTVWSSCCWEIGRGGGGDFLLAYCSLYIVYILHCIDDWPDDHNS